MTSHFWMDSRPGMAWSAGLVLVAMTYVSLRGLTNLPSARVPLAARLPMGLAFLNAIAAAGLGLVLAVNKLSPFLPVRQLDAVHAHAHLAALGFGAMMVVGAGFRMLPMILPAAMPQGMSDDVIRKLFEEGSYEIVPHDSMRKTIARRLVEAKATIPHFYLTVDCRIDKLLALRAEINAAAPLSKGEKGDVPAYKLSVNDLVIKALALALRAVPEANVTWTGEGISAPWARATWTCDTCASGDAGIDPTRSTWSRSTWSRSTWSSVVEW